MNDRFRQFAHSALAAASTATVRQGAGGRRRGNTLVLVAAVLALLAIIATAYISRTQSQRQVSVAQQSATMRNENVDLIAESIAEHVADALFVWPVDWRNDPYIWDDDNFPTLPASTNVPRKQPAANAKRYGVDEQWVDTNDDEVSRAFTYNFAPYHTVPFTNWPTPQTLANEHGLSWFDAVTLVPAGPGNPGSPNDPNEPIPGAENVTLAFESNPMGNPGFGDARWLADAEPVRYTLDDNFEAFSHWRKMTNVATPNNSWRPIADISDVDRTVVTDITIPVEQWPAVFRPNPAAQMFFGSPPSGNTSMDVFDDGVFIRQWANWFGFDVDFNDEPDGRLQPWDFPIRAYLFAFGQHNFANPQPSDMPSNLLQLSDLNADGQRHSYFVDGIPQDRPESEFIPGTARHTVGRVLTDTTGDGFTDAFWFDPGLPAKDGVRQIVAVRIEDNSSRLNANVATRFHRNESDFGFDDPDEFPTKTRGTTPADIALVGQLRRYGENLDDGNIEDGDHWNVGFYDNPANWGWGMLDPLNPNYDTAYDTRRWRRHWEEIGLRVWNPDGIDPFEEHFLTEFDRRDYWRRSARHGLDGQPTVFPGEYDPWQFAPFPLSDDLVLRMHHGNNYGWLHTGFEWSTQDADPDTIGFLRSSSGVFESIRHEQSEYEDQLNNRQLVMDNRRKLTLHSGARNDLLPPWLWWENRYVPGWDFEGVNICADSTDEPDIERIERVWAAMPQFTRNLISALCSLDMSGVQANQAFRRFLAQSRQKLDLREIRERYYYFEGDGTLQYHFPEADRGRMNFRERLAPTLMMALTDSPMVLEWDRLYTSYFGDYLVFDPANPGLLEVEEDDRRYYRNPEGNLNNTRRMAASFAANILAHRSTEPIRIVRDRILLPQFGHVYDADTGNLEPVFREGELEPLDPGDPSIPGDPPPQVGHIALDYQPFLVEAAIGFMYAATKAPRDFPAQNIFEGDDVFCERDPITIVLVEIANPFDVPVDLSDFAISVYGHHVLLQDDPDPLLGPGESRIYYSMPQFADLEDDDDGDGGGGIVVPNDIDVEKWEAFFGLRATTDGGEPGDDLLNNVVNVRLFEGGGIDGENNWWPADRAEYDPPALSGPEFDEFVAKAIELRRIEVIDGEDVWYTVDRVDPVGLGDDELGRAVAGADGNTSPFRYDPIFRHFPDHFADEGNILPDCVPPDFGIWQAATVAPQTCFDADTGANRPCTHVFQWVHAQRAHGIEPIDGSELYIPTNERNPRFVFATRHVDLGDRDDEGDRPLHTVALRQSGQPQDWVGDGKLPQAGFGEFIREYDGDGRLFMPFRMNMKNVSAYEGGLFDPTTNPDLQVFDFEQIGELFNVWLFGHELEFDQVLEPGQEDWVITRTTFSEFLIDSNLNGLFDRTEEVDSGDPDNEEVQVVNCWARLIGDDELTDECATWLRDGDAHRIGRLRTQPWITTVQNSDEIRSIGAVLNRPKTPADLEDLIPGFFSSEQLEMLWRRYRADDRHGSPALPAGLYVLDAFVADGPGALVRNRDDLTQWFDLLGNQIQQDGDLTVFEQVQRRRLFNANGFNGRITPGLININTATPEVLRTLPHMTRLVHEFRNDVANNPLNHVALALQRYRERLGAPTWDAPFGEEWGPAYAHRGRSVKNAQTGDPQPFFADPGGPSGGGDGIAGFIPGMRGDRGMASIGEMMLLTQSGREGMDWVADPDSPEGFFHFRYDEVLEDDDAADVMHRNSNFRIDYPRLPARKEYLTDLVSGGLYTDVHPQAFLFPDDSPDEAPSWMDRVPRRAALSIDIHDRSERFVEDFMQNHMSNPDFEVTEVTEDAREANMLFSGISNMITTRSDVFTVYFRVRSFRQNPSTGVWDATDREQIVDDARYVMLIDRSEVNRPGDQPKILYFQRMPD